MRINTPLGGNVDYYPGNNLDSFIIPCKVMHQMHPYRALLDLVNVSNKER